MNMKCILWVFLGFTYGGERHRELWLLIGCAGGSSGGGFSWSWKHTQQRLGTLWTGKCVRLLGAYRVSCGSLTCW